MVFGVTGNALICTVGIIGFKTLRNSIKSLKKILTNGNNKNTLKIRNKKTKYFLMASALTLFGCCLLIIIQVGLNFVTISKAT